MWEKVWASVPAANVISAFAFYAALVIYVASELYYNRYYWRLVLRKSRRSRWEYMLWVERIALVVLGFLTIWLTLRTD